MSPEALNSINRPLCLHIGHHFFGSGNLGDDLMLGGFLAALRTQPHKIELTCASPFDLQSQRRRFPEIRWTDYDPAVREESIRICDAWIGVGGTPFQIVVGPWFLDHLAAELDLCLKHNKLMYFIGIGVNEAEALADSRAKSVLQHAQWIWTRDPRSAELIGQAGFSDKVSPAADLAHVYLRHAAKPAAEPRTVGCVLNFEDTKAFNPASLESAVRSLPDHQHRWLIQEDRPLAGSERAILQNLPDDLRRRLDVRIPDYANGSLEALLDAWGAPETLVTSRYHAALIGAWRGARVVCVERSEKIRGVVAQLQVASTPDLTDPQAMLDAMRRASPVDPELLARLAELAEKSCSEMMADLTERNQPMTNRAELASVESKDSSLFQSFMGMMNAFAGSLGLRTFTSWSKIWEYPWLWHATLSHVHWPGKHVVDLGSEISPMPWFLATLGAKVTLIEVDSQWVPVWEALRQKLHVDVSWYIVRSEAIPLPSASADVVTSFSVIEHQPDKGAAINEVVRVLKPGGTFAVSFDICEPEMGMTFPEWNGRALTLREFEDVLWLHPAWGNTTRPTWNRTAIDPFLAWHRTTAPHHNYVAGAATLRKK